MVLPFQPVKNQAFTVGVDSELGNAFYFPITASITKDGGSDAATTNAPTISPNIHSDGSQITLVLTAAEMNANIITVTFYANNNSIVAQTTFYTSGIAFAPVQTQGGLDLSTPVTNVSAISDANPTFGEVISLVWQAMTHTQKKHHWSFTTWLNKFDF